MPQVDLHSSETPTMLPGRQVHPMARPCVLQRSGVLFYHSSHRQSHLHCPFLPTVPWAHSSVLASLGNRTRPLVTSKLFRRLYQKSPEKLCKRRTKLPSTRPRILPTAATNVFSAFVVSLQLLHPSYQECHLGQRGADRKVSMWSQPKVAQLGLADHATRACDVDRRATPDASRTMFPVRQPRMRRPAREPRRQCALPWRHRPQGSVLFDLRS